MQRDFVREEFFILSDIYLSAKQSQVLSLGIGLTMLALNFMYAKISLSFHYLCYKSLCWFTDHKARLIVKGQPCNRPEGYLLLLERRKSVQLQLTKLSFLAALSRPLYVRMLSQANLVKRKRQRWSQGGDTGRLPCGSSAGGRCFVVHLLIASFSEEFKHKRSLTVTAFENEPRTGYQCP